MFNFIERSLITKKVFVTLLIGVIVIGLYAYKQIPSYDFAQLKTNIFNIKIVHPGLSAKYVDQEILQDLERGVQNLSGVTFFEFKATDMNFSYGIVVFDHTMDQATVKQELLSVIDSSDKIDEVKFTLETIDAMGGGKKFPKMKVLVDKGPLSDDEFIDVLKDMDKQINRIKSVDDVKISGMPERMFVVFLDPVSMAQYSIDLHTVLTALHESKTILPVVDLYSQEKGSLQLPVIEKSWRNAYDMMQLGLHSRGAMDIEQSTGKVGAFAPSIKLKDIAEVQVSYSPFDFSHYNEKMVVVLNIFASRNADLVGLSRNVIAFLDGYKQKLPISYKVLDDRGFNVGTQVSNFMNTILSAILLNAALVILFVGLQFGLSVVLTIPITFLILFIYMYFTGMALSFMSLFACVLGIGLIVDTSIIIADMTQVNLREGMSLPQAYSNALKVMLAPVLSANLTTISVFLPMWLLSTSIMSESLKDLILPIVLLLVLSMVVSIFIMPLVTMLLFPNVEAKQGLAYNFMKSLEQKYSEMLTWILSSKKGIITGLACLFFVVVGSIVYIIASNTRFSVEPKQIITSYNVNFKSSGSISKGESYKLMQTMIEKFRNMEDVDYVITNYQNLDAISYTVHLVDMQYRKINDPLRYTQMLYGLLPQDLSNVVWSVSARSDIGAPGMDFSMLKIHVLSENINELLVAIPVIEKELKNMPDLIDGRYITYDRLVSKKSEETSDKHSLKLLLNTSKAKDYLRTIPVGAMMQYLQMFSREGLKVDEFNFSEHEYKIPVYLKFEEKYQNLPGLMGMTVPNGLGQAMQLSEFLELKFDPSLSFIAKHMGLYAELIYIPMKKRNNDYIFTRLNKLIADGEIPSSIQIKEYDPNLERSSMKNFWTQSMVLSFCLIMLILFLQFGSFWQIGVSCVSLLMSCLGAVFLVSVVGNGFSVMMSGMGLACLMGVVVNHNIVLLDAYNRYRVNNTVLDSVIQACTSRLRPILLTTLTTVLAISPIIFGIQVLWTEFTVSLNTITSAVWFDFSLAFGGGLTIGTLYTLLAVPLLIVIGEYVVKFFTNIANKLWYTG